MFQNFQILGMVGLLEQILPQGAEDEEEGPGCLGEEGGVPHMVGQDDQVEMVRLVTKLHRAVLTD